MSDELKVIPFPGRRRSRVDIRAFLAGRLQSWRELLGAGAPLGSVLMEMRFVLANIGDEA